ncbi:MAG: flagellar basal-body rod modification protein FlgD, partial [Porticoccaceae bacterium]
MIDTLTASSFLTTEQYSKQQDTSMAVEEELGRDAFLTLLTTQLTNQSPLDPMDNEAFVAQLAQFSQVEGIKGMQTSLEDMVSGMRQDQMMSGANLVGKKVSIEGGSFFGGNGQ